MGMMDRLLEPIRRKLRLMVTRGVVKLIDDARGLQELQVSGLAGELLDLVERIQNYGFTSNPHSESDCLILNVGADRSRAIVIAVDDRRYRLHLVNGEVAMYDDQGQAVKLLRTGIVIDAPKGTIHNGDMDISGNLTVDGDISASGKVSAATAAITGKLDAGQLVINGLDFANHVHGGVTTGGASTGGPA